MSHHTARRNTARRTRSVGPVLLGIMASGVLLAGALSASRTEVVAAPPQPGPTAGAAIDWIGEELDANTGTMPGFTPGSSDWGLTADAILAHVAAGRSTDAAARTATDLLAVNAAEFTTYSTATPPAEVRVAGATGKVLLVLRAMGRDTTADGIDLEAELRSVMITTGSQRGRFADRVPDPAWDSSNGFGQSFSMLGLALTPGGVPDDAVSFLLAQQCPAGGFRLIYLATPGCVSDEDADSDATALAAQAILAAPRTEQTTASATRALQWLLGRQTTDGSFGGTGPTSGSNANSTGLIGQTMRAAGQNAAADRAASWIVNDAQLSAELASATPAAGDIGAIAYTPTARAIALGVGVTDQIRDQWRRSTTQAVLALGLAPFGPQNVEALPPVPTTSTSTTTTTSTVPPNPTTPNPSTPNPTTPAPSTSTPAPITVPNSVPNSATSTPVAAATVLSGAVTGGAATASTAGGGTSPERVLSGAVGNSARSSTGAVAATSLSRTGGDVGTLGALAAVLILVGCVLAGTARRRSG